MKEPLLLRYWYADGRPQAAFPMHVVEDGPERKVGWLLVGTEISYWSTADGADPRSLSLDLRFRSPLTTTPRVWQGDDVLRVMPMSKPYQVIHFWSAGVFTGWYVNFESPLTWNGRVGDSRDWHLDLWISASGKPAWKDEDEAAFASEHGHVTRLELDLARAIGQEIMADFDCWLSQIGDWRQSRPDNGLQPLQLPAEWASL